MKFLCSLNHPDSFLEMKSLADGIVLTNDTVSSRYDYSFDKDEILSLVKKCNTARMECYLLVNGIFTDDTIGYAYDMIDTFKDTNLLYIFGDLGVYQILKEFDICKKGIYMPDTLVTNYLDYTFWKDYKVKGLFPSLEITLNDVKTIGKNKKVKLYYKGFGKSVMFHSKRKLLSTYRDYKNLEDFTTSNDLYLKEETRDDLYKIIENSHGTQIFQSGVHNILPAMDIIFDELDYLFLDGTYLDFSKYKEVFRLYKEASCDMDHLNLYNDKIETLFNDLTYDFMYEDSVFRKSDF